MESLGCKKDNETLQEEIQILKKQLKKLERLAAVGQLAVCVAHEINNPLGYVYSNFKTAMEYFNKYKEILYSYKSFIGDLENLSSKEIALEIERIQDIEDRDNLKFICSDIDQLFGEVKQGLRKINDIVSGLKTFSREHNEDQLEEYDLNEGIKDMVMMMQNEAKQYVQIIEQLGDIPIIKALGSQISQVVLNMIINSIDSIKAKKSNEIGIIIIDTKISNRYIVCNIQDNGIGIEGKNMDKIFKPFFTTKPIGQGTGLGLSIAYDIIVNRHGGLIDVESTYGVGTKFTIKLPINT